MNVSHNDPIAHIGQALSARRMALKKTASTPITQRRAQTQTLLLKAGRELIIEQGIAGTSVGDICTRAGFSRGAFYSNFTDMDHFVQKLAQEQWGSVTNAVDKALENLLNEEPSPGNILSESLSPWISQLFKVLPISRESYLMQSELCTYLARSSDKDNSVGQGFEEFKKHLETAFDIWLKRADLISILPLADATELILACTDRSVNIALASGESELTNYLNRTLPILLTALTRPK